MMMIAEISPPVASPGPGVGAGGMVGPGFAAALSAALPVARADAATMPAVVLTMPADTTVPSVSPDPGVDMPATGADPDAAPLMPPALRKMPERPLIPRVAGAPAIAPPAEALKVHEPEPLRSEQLIGRRAAVARRDVPAVPLVPDPSASAYNVPSLPIVVPLIATAGPHNSLAPASLPVPPVAEALPPTIGPTVGIPVPLASFEADLPPTIGPTVGVPAPLPSYEWPLPPTTGPTVGTSAQLPATPVSQASVLAAMAPPVVPASQAQAPIASRGTDVAAEVPTAAPAAGRAVPTAVPSSPSVSGGPPPVRDGVAKDRADPPRHALALPRLPDAPPLSAAPQLSATPQPGFAPPLAAASAPLSNAAPPATLADTARVADAGALTVTTPALGDVRIALDGGPQDLRVSLALGAGGAMLINADAARLGTDLAAQGLRLQSLDVGSGGGGGGGGGSGPGHNSGSNSGETRRPVPPRLFVAQPSDRFATPDRYA